jgi:hypothetical protein
MTDADDTIRSTVGVVACLRDIGNGSSKLTLDDVSGDRTNNPVAWTFTNFYTGRDYENEPLDEMNLSAAEYQMIGENLVARLLALNGRVK